MGGDFGPPILVQAACLALSRHPHLNVILVGDKKRIEEQICTLDKLISTRMKIVEASEQVEMDEKPSQALRQKSQSSMAVALNLVATEQAQAVVSSGNTGALMAFSRKILKMIPGISRPAIISSVPTEQNKSRLIDLGANVDCSPEQLFQFAQMGSALVKAISEKDIEPTVALLNIGSESIKGNDQTKHTHELLSRSTDLNYLGFIEGNEVYTGNVDIIVCDGFVGNVLIKASEGVARMVIHRLQTEFKRSWWTRVLATVVISVLKSFRKRVNPDQYNGASFVGLQGVVIKSHGGANVSATVVAIEEAIREASNNIPRKIQQQLLKQLEQ